MSRFTGLLCIAAMCVAMVMASPAIAQDKSKGEEPQKKDTAMSDKPKIADREYVRMKTNMGDMVIELNREKAPITVENFLRYIDEGFYDGTIFHRVIKTFVIQGGGFDQDMNKKQTHEGIQNEWRNGLKNDRGTLSMARLPNQPNSATSQFFINIRDNSPLDTPRDGAAYAVFGKVIDGMDVVDKIKEVQTTTKNGMGDVPAEPVIIEHVWRLDPEEIKGLIAKVREAEEAEKKKAAEAKANQWNQSLELVKAKGIDVSKGTTSDTGLWSFDITVGEGDSPKPTDNVKVHYTGWLPDGKEFDSSFKRNQPASFPLNRVIKGWTEGVGGMKAGGKRMLIIPGDLAYPQGRPGIPAGSVLVFEVELLSINE